MKQKLIKFIKRMLITIGILIGVLILAYFLFVNLSPQFGGKISDEAKLRYETSTNYKDGLFKNKSEVDLNMKFGDMVSVMFKFFQKTPGTTPEKDLPIQKIDSTNIANYNGEPRLVWFGHSTFLMQLENKTIVFDPMFGKVPAPHPTFGTKRFTDELPIEIDALPTIDAVLISHDHYDHLDYESIQKIKDKVKMFYTPLGISAHLIEWGVEKEKIVELDWWQEAIFQDLTFVCTPAKHFSGRGLSDRQHTLWSSWVIQANNSNIFFSGDSGYDSHFKEIGNKYGPFDFAMIECGQYNELWPDVHMFPEETAQAGIDVKAKTIMPIHWGAFKLAMHTWKDPINRVTKKAKELQIDLIAPQIGETILLNNTQKIQSTWWK